MWLIIKMCGQILREWSISKECNKGCVLVSSTVVGLQEMKNLFISVFESNDEQNVQY